MVTQASFVTSQEMTGHCGVYIALEELDFMWSRQQIKIVRKLWNDGVAIDEIAKEVRRHVDEVALLIMDQARKGIIQSRKNGVWGEVA